jgi:hypothetical protein
MVLPLSLGPFSFILIFGPTAAIALLLAGYIRFTSGLTWDKLVAPSHPRE